MSDLKDLYRRMVPSDARMAFWRLRGRIRRAAAARSLSCHLCENREVEPFAHPAADRVTHDLFQCKTCQLIFVHPLPNVGAYYGEGTGVPELGPGEEEWNQLFLEALRPHATAAQPEVLEIGFGNASFLSLLHAQGWQTHGIDLSQANVRRAREVLALPNLSLGTIDEASYPESSFDVIVGLNFLEHVPSPRFTLGRIRTLLRPGGVVAILCPDLDGVFHLLVEELFGDRDPVGISWTPPEHLYYFNRENLRTLIEGCGFDIVADQSALTPALWRQHELRFGAAVTSARRERLLEEIARSSLPRGKGRVQHHWEELRALTLQRMVGTLLADVVELEAALGAENASFFVCRRTS